MTIKDAVFEDEGTYTLKVINKMGYTTVSVKVTAVQKEMDQRPPQGQVEEAFKVIPQPVEVVAMVPEPTEPKILVAPHPVEFEEGETIVLSCKVAGQQMIFTRRSIKALASHD